MCGDWRHDYFVIEQFARLGFIMPYYTGAAGRRIGRARATTEYRYVPYTARCKYLMLFVFRRFNYRTEHAPGLQFTVRSMICARRIQ